ncbi:hypothetical protein ABVT39_016775 [Epinephelus coioides]
MATSFEELNQLTDARSETFFYTEEDVESILLPHTAFENLVQAEDHGTDAKCLFSELEDLRKQETRLLWHAVTLSEYRRQQRIPRGLRINKAPAFGTDDPAFMKRWEQILNKCSLDLEVLLIEKSKAERSKKLEAIKSLETKVNTLPRSDEVTQMEGKMMNSLDSFKIQLKQYKMRKYQRDVKDYKEGTVYQWQKPTYKWKLRTRAKTGASHQHDQYPSSSTFYPSTNLSPIIVTFNKLVERDFEEMLKKDKGPKYSNLNYEERKALEELEKNPEIIIRPADKGGAVVVLDTEYYHHKMLEHLMSPTYRKLEKNPLNEFKSEIDNLLKVALESNWITKKEHAYLTNQYPVTPIIYSLPKIHKHPTEPPLRPIVSGRGSVTEPLSQYVDFFLKDFVKALPAYLGDTKDVLNCLSDCILDQNTILVSLDVENLYGCIPHEDALNSAAHYLSKRETQNPPNAFLLELLHLVLSRNYMQYDSKWFLQQAGTAMGTATAPSVAGLVVGKWEEAVIHDPHNNPYHSKIKLYKRYIDDILLFWEGTQGELMDFVSHVNNSSRFLKFTCEYSFDKINFLDLTIHKEETGAIHTSIYRKDMERNSILHASSNHPRHLKDNIPAGQFLRLKRNCSDPDDFHSKTTIMANRFMERGYASNSIQKAIQRANSTPRSDLLSNTQKTRNPSRACFSTEYNHCASQIKQIIKRHWHVLQAEPSLKDFWKSPPLFSFRRASTIKNIVMYKNMTPNKTTWLTTTGMYRCGNCACCNNTTNTKSFNHPHTGKKIPIQEFINCKSTHVVYMLSCPCGLVYVGQTKRPLKQRISEHKTAIRTGNMDYAIAKHYAEANHGSPSSLRFCGIEKITIPTRGGDVLKKLAQREMFWIYILNTMAPNGLNDDFSLKCFLG